MSEAFDELGYRDRTVVVTGVSSGMGEATARLLGNFGAHVHIVDIRPPRVPRAGFHRCDLSDFAAVRATAQALAALAPIHFLFPCATIPPHLLGAMQAMMVNYIGTRHFIEHLIPALEDGAGIALISSDAAMGWQKTLAQSLEMLPIADPDAAIAWVQADPEKRLRDGYTTSKEMLAVWVQHHAVRLGNERRVCLNAIAPYPTKTAFMEQTAGQVGTMLDEWPHPSLGRTFTVRASPSSPSWPARTRALVRVWRR